MLTHSLSKTSVFLNVFFFIIKRKNQVVSALLPSIGQTLLITPET